MVIPFDINEVRDYSLNGDEEENKTVFHLGFMDEPVRNYIFKLIQKDASNPDTFKQILRYGLKGWENFNAPFVLTTKSDSSIDAKARLVVSDESLATLYHTWIVEIATEISSMNLMGTKEKN